MFASLLVLCLLSASAFAQIDPGSIVEEDSGDSGDSGDGGGDNTDGGGTDSGGDSGDTAEWVTGGSKVSDVAGEEGGFGCEETGVAGLVIGLSLLGLGRRRRCCG